jgi:hypothetical protein
MFLIRCIATGKVHGLCYGAHYFLIQQSEDRHCTVDIRTQYALFDDKLPAVSALDTMQAGPDHHAHSEVAETKLNCILKTTVL